MREWVELGEVGRVTLRWLVDAPSHTHQAPAQHSTARRCCQRAIWTRVREAVYDEKSATLKNLAATQLGSVSFMHRRPGCVLV